MILIIIIMIIKIILATIITIESTSDTLSVQEVSVRLMLWSPWGGEGSSTGGVGADHRYIQAHMDCIGEVKNSCMLLLLLEP